MGFYSSNVIPLADKPQEYSHVKTYWLSKLNPQTASNFADETLNPYRCTSGNNMLGAVENLINTNDLPRSSGAFYRIKGLLISALSHSTAYKLILLWGETTASDALKLGQYEIIDVSGNSDNEYVKLEMEKIGIENNLWCQCWNVTNGATIDFLLDYQEL